MTDKHKEVTILLVEDDDIDAKAVERGLRKLKIANPLVRATNGLEALNILRAKDIHNTVSRPFLILLDLNMPVMNGLDFLQKIREDADLVDSVVFVLTTSQADTDRMAAYKENIAGYIVKSNVRDGFSDVLKMLDHYWRVVLLPE